jgi:hypothetical protein
MFKLSTRGGKAQQKFADIERMFDDVTKRVNVKGPVVQRSFSLK